MSDQINNDEIVLESGKYTLTGIESGNLRALRYGEEWRSFVGDKLVLSLAQEIRRLSDELESAKERLSESEAGEGLERSGVELDRMIAVVRTEERHRAARCAEALVPGADTDPEFQRGFHVGVIVAGFRIRALGDA